MSVDVRATGSQLATLAWVALRALLGTIFAFTFAGVVLAGISYSFLRDHPWPYGVIAAAIALVESVTTGVVLGAKRAVVKAAAHGFGRLRLGRSLVGLVFERMLGIAASDEMGERGGRMSRQLERLPFAQAEELLGRAVRGLTGDAEQVGWLRRKIQARLLTAVQKYTLSRFREEGSVHGGVDLLKVKEELEATVDDILVQKLRGGLRLWITLVSIGLPLVVAAQTYFILMLLRSD